MERARSRPLSPVPEEQEDDENQKKEVREEQAESEISEDEEALPLEVTVHDVKAKLYLNCADADIIPVRYLEKADRLAILKRVPWIFRGTDDGRAVSLNKWSKVDIRFRGVFQTLKKVPLFAKGLFENDGGKMTSSKVDLADAVKQQGNVVYALLDEILDMLKLKREMNCHQKYFYLRPRLLTVRPEYWTGFRVKHKDSPTTAATLTLDYYPEKTEKARAVVPVMTTSKLNQPLREALEGEFKLLLAQLLVNIYRLLPPADKLPDQEAFLIFLHGSKLHLLRGVFPGQKTSRLWSGRHNASDNAPNLASAIGERFYDRTNLERLIEEFEWSQLSNPENEACPRGFQILGSREYDMWRKWEFAAAVRMLAGLCLYLFSGQARCGILQHVFRRFPYDEGLDPESEDEAQGEEEAIAEKVAEEQKKVEAAEKKLKEKQKQKRKKEKTRATERESMRSSMKDRIGSLAEGFRQPWWDWVWEDKHKDGCPKDESDVILNGP
ncbi:hypothetical protein BJX61DRAFT_552678 [Aspergillus egyptiacus]|nr:hypothetical protein BJX61DRAFT_552678 [Aspergillus egyptiacus]